MQVAGRTFREVWLVDFEFHAPPGENPTVICLVARELGSGRLLRLWHDEIGRLDQPPYVAGSAQALNCSRTSGWEALVASGGTAPACPAKAR